MKKVAAALLLVTAMLGGMIGGWTGEVGYAAEPKKSERTAVIAVEQTVEAGLRQFLDRALVEAEASGADSVVLAIDTFGGRVDAAIDIGDLVRSSPLRTIAYVQNKAISAGSYIALNADEIYMEPGSTIGAAAPVMGDGERVTDSKIVSVWRGAMEAAAETNGRNTGIAAGMVDDSMTVEMPEIGRTKQPGQLITLTAKEALAVGYAEGIVGSMDELMAVLGSPEVQTIEPTPAERVARVLTHPAVATALLTIGIAGLLIELLVPGFGIPGILGIAAFGLYFLGNYVAGFAGVEHMALFIVGIVLLLAELFIPSFGILGILGIVSLISGVVLAAYDTGDALKSLGIAFLISGVIVAVFVKYFHHRGVWHRFILKDSLHTKEGYVSHSAKEALLGRVGTSITPLRPSGTMLLDGERVDVVTSGQFIDASKPVQVIQVEGARIVVKEAAEKPENE